MPVNVIPFQMPEPMEIPPHLVESLQQLPTPEALRKGMELLMQIDVADVMLLERVDDEGRLQLAEVLAREATADPWRATLAGESFYGQPLSEEASGLAGQALSQGQALLVLGQTGADETSALPPALTAALLGETGGSVGFLYVLPLIDASGRAKGALTLIRAASEGPLNHEQPNLTEAMRRLLTELLAAA